MSYENIHPQRVGIGQFIKSPPPLLENNPYLSLKSLDLFKPNVMMSVL